jgi:polyribonucleotide nucleotidyltransferase
MDRTMAEPRAELSCYAPRILSMKVKQSQIGAVIGPGGKMIRAITEATGATINIEDDGTVTIGSVDPEAGEKALAWVQSIVEEAVVDKTYTGTVKRVMPFGAFVEILPGKEGLVHISELEHRRVEKVEDVLNEGDEVQVKVIGIDDQGKIKLSRKALLDRPEGSGKSGGDRRGSHRTRR